MLGAVGHDFRLGEDSLNGRARAQRGLIPRWIAITLAGAALLASGCGDGDDRLSKEEFSDRVTPLQQQVSEKFGELEKQARTERPEAPLSEDVKRLMEDFATAARRFTDELEKLKPPEEAEEATDQLIDGARERAEAFEQAARQEGVTLRDLDQSPELATKLRQSGEKVDRAVQELRQKGFLSAQE